MASLAPNTSPLGTLTLNLTPQDELVYYIVGSMPEIFVEGNSSFQLFPYEIKITAQSELSLENAFSQQAKYEVARYNLLGQKTTNQSTGFQIVKYNDGSSQKIYNHE